MAGQIEATYGARYRTLDLTYSVEAAPMGTGGALALARAALGPGDPLLVLNGDSFVDVDLAALVAAHRGAATLTLVEVADASRYGQVTLGPDGRVTAFVEKGATTGPGLINAGVYVLAASVLAGLPDGPSSLERDVLPALVAAGFVSGFPSPCSARFASANRPNSMSRVFSL